MGQELSSQRDIWSLILSKVERGLTIIGRDSSPSSLHYEPLDSTTRRLVLTIPPYIIQKDGSYYAFDKAELYTTLRVIDSSTSNDSQHFRFMHRPRLLDPDYCHPLVLHGLVDYGPLREFPQSYRSSHLILDQEMLSSALAFLFWRGRFLLEYGCYQIGKPHFIPVNLLKECHCKIADSQANAEHYAQAHAIPLERIIIN